MEGCDWCRPSGDDTPHVLHRVVDAWPRTAGLLMVADVLIRSSAASESSIWADGAGVLIITEPERQIRSSYAPMSRSTRPPRSPNSRPRARRVSPAKSVSLSSFVRCRQTLGRHPGSAPDIVPLTAQVQRPVMRGHPCHTTVRDRVRTPPCGVASGKLCFSPHQ